MFKYFIENNLISPNQSGFETCGSCTNQLISITHETYQYFDNGFDIRGVFIDISKDFESLAKWCYL